MKNTLTPNIDLSKVMSKKSDFFFFFWMTGKHTLCIIEKQ